MEFNFDTASGIEGMILGRAAKKLNDGQSIGIRLELIPLNVAVDEAVEEGIEPDYRRVAESQRTGGLGMRMSVEGDHLTVSTLIKKAFDQSPEFYKLMYAATMAYTAMLDAADVSDAELED